MSDQTKKCLTEEKTQARTFSDYLAAYDGQLAELFLPLREFVSENFEKLRTGDASAVAYVRYLLASAGSLLPFVFLPGHPIIPLARYLSETVKISNRIVSFVLEDRRHFGSGMLVGPSHVLTAAHLFFTEQGVLIDRNRLRRITAEVHTTLIGDVIVEGARSTAGLYKPDSDKWIIDPITVGELAQRDVYDLDFAIVRLDKPLGDELVGAAPRGWFEVPTAASAELLAPDVALQVFEFLDRERLLTSTGFVRGLERNGMRVLHTASTASSASGAPILSMGSGLIAMHLGGAFSGEVPPSNRALPIRRVAEVIDQSVGGATIRSLLKN